MFDCSAGRRLCRHLACGASRCALAQQLLVFFLLTTGHAETDLFAISGVDVEHERDELMAGGGGGRRTRALREVLPKYSVRARGLIPDSLFLIAWITLLPQTILIHRGGQRADKHCGWQSAQCLVHLPPFKGLAWRGAAGGIVG